MKHITPLSDTEIAKVLCDKSSLFGKREVIVPDNTIILCRTNGIVTDEKTAGTPLRLQKLFGRQKYDCCMLTTQPFCLHLQSDPEDTILTGDDTAVTISVSITAKITNPLMFTSRLLRKKTCICKDEMGKMYLEQITPEIREFVARYSYEELTLDTNISGLNF